MDEISGNQFNGAIEMRSEITMLSVLRHIHCRFGFFQEVRPADLQVAH